MNRNPFSQEVDSIIPQQSKNKFQFISGETKPEPLIPDNFNQMSKTERSAWLFNFLGKSGFDLIDKCIKKVSNPLITNANSASNILMAQKSAMQGEDTAEIYKLITLLSNKRPYVGMKAAAILEEKVCNDKYKVIIENYFKFNPDAQTKYHKLYRSLKSS